MDKDAASGKETGQTAAAETAGSISDDIEYTLLIHEVSDLTIPVPAAQPADKTEAEAAAEKAEGPAETEEADAGPAEAEKAATETASPASDDDIEYTLLIHEVPDLTIPVPAAQPAEKTGSEAAEEETEGSAETEETAEAPAEAEKDEETAGSEEAAEEAPEETGESAETEETSEETEETEESADSEEKEGASYGLPEEQTEMGELTKRIEARRRYNERKKRRFRTRFYIIVTILVLVISFMLISLSSIFTVDSIEVRGNQHYTAEEIINMGHAVPGHNLIYHLNRQETVEYLEQNPYIKHATVSRKLPSTMVIKVTERAEKMAFRYDDDYLIMDEDGILLKKTRNVPKATLIEGIVVNKIKLGEKIGAVEAGRLDRAIDLIHSMTSADMYFVKVDMSKDDIVKAYIYDTLAVKADYDILIANLENGRLHLVVEKLFSDGIERGTIIFEEDGTASFMPAI